MEDKFGSSQEITRLVDGDRFRGTKRLTESLRKNEPISFTKFGDGEYSCIHHPERYQNSDRDRYTPELSAGISRSFDYLSKQSNVLIGAWHGPDVLKYWADITGNLKSVNWCNYHTVIIDNDTFVSEAKLNLYTAVKESSRKKILVSNPLLIKAKLLLNIQHHVIVDFNNWFPQYQSILVEVRQIIQDDPEPLVITCAGMGSKPLIADLHKLYPKGIFLDFGSALDFLCTKRNTRGMPITYQNLTDYFNSIIPDGWDDSSFESIYQEANLRRLGNCC